MPRSVPSSNAAFSSVGTQRGDVDHPARAVRLQRRIEALAGPQCARDVHVHQPVPLGLFHLRGLLAERHPGDVQQNVHPAELREHRIAQGVDRLALLHVANLPQRLAAQRFNLVADRLQLRLAASRRHHGGSRLGQAHRQYRADTRRPTHHDRDAARQIHEILCHNSPQSIRPARRFVPVAPKTGYMLNEYGTKPSP